MQHSMLSVVNLLFLVKVNSALSCLKISLAYKYHDYIDSFYSWVFWCPYSTQNSLEVFSQATTTPMPHLQEFCIKSERINTLSSLKLLDNKALYQSHPDMAEVES